MTHEQTNPQEHCERCKRLAPPWKSSQYSDWEAITLDDGEIGVMCPGCLTWEEQQAMDEDSMEMGAQIEADKAEAERNIAHWTKRPRSEFLATDNEPLDDEAP